MGADTALLRIGARSGQYDRAWEHCIMIGDSLVIILANDEQVNIQKLHLRSDMFEPIGKIWSDETDRINTSSATGIFVWLMFGLLSIGVAWFFFSRKSEQTRSYFWYPRKQTFIEPINDEYADWSVFWKGLRPGHQILLRYLAVEGDPEKGVDAEDINHVLGISRRPHGLQKVHRNRALHSINQAYQQTFRTEALLIDRLKDPLDRRQTRFCITQEKQQMIKLFFKHMSNSI